MSHLHAISLWMHILIFLKWIWRSGTATSQNSFMFNSLKTRLFSKSAESQYIPISSVCGFQLLHLLTKTCYYLFDCKRPSGGEAVPHCGLNLHLDDNLILSSIFSYTIFFSGWMCKVKSASRSVVSDSLWPHGLYSPWASPGQNTGVGSLSLLQGILLTQGVNPGLPPCRRTLY